MAGSIETTAEAIGKRGLRVGSLLVGMDPILIISIAQLVLGFVGDCVKNSGLPGRPGGAGSYPDYIADHYDSESDTFEESVMGPMRGHTRHAARILFRHGQGPRPSSYTQEQLTALSHDTLMELMQSPGAAVSCIAEINN